MISPGIVFAFCAMISWSISVFPFTRASRLMTVESLNLVRLVLGTGLIALTAFVLEFSSMASIFTGEHWQGWLWMGISGIVALGIGDYFGLKMYTILSPRYGSVLTTLSPAMALVMGYVLLNERMNITGIVGMAITAFGVMSMSLGRKERSQIPNHGHGSIMKGIFFGIISAFCNGAGLAFSKKGFLEESSKGFKLTPLTASFMRFFLATVVIVLLMGFSNRIQKNIKNILSQPFSVLRLAGAGVLFGPLAGVGFALTAIQYIDVAVAQTVFALVPVAALLIAHFFYKEKITRAALAGVIIAIAGVSILIWRTMIQEYLF